MRTFVSNDQAYNIVDTTQRVDPVQIILRATDNIPIFWSQERADLEGNIDAGGNPAAGMLLLNTDPPLVLNGFRGIIWARATGATRIECQVVSQKIGITGPGSPAPRFPGTATPVGTRPVSNVKLPGLANSWYRKGVS